MTKEQKKQSVIEALRNEIDAMELLTFIKKVALEHGWQSIGQEARTLLDKRGLTCLYVKDSTEGGESK